MSKQPLVIYDFRNPEEAFALMDGKKQGIITEELANKLTYFVIQLQKQLNEANHCIKHCSTHPCCEKYLKKWGVK